VRLAALLAGALGRRQDGQKGQDPHALAPRNRREQSILAQRRPLV
jgi:hypothetical protein